ncbi:MAG: SDR family oxidoreductase [Treponema sp.]|nr:SDR family oxidoreductase [Treponema sp.]
MKVLVTGSSRGIGRQVCIKFLEQGHDVFGIDVLADTISTDETVLKRNNYAHYVADISIKDSLPDIPGVQILINNAGIQTATEKDISVNLLGTMAVTEKYAFQPCIKSVLFNSSVSSLTGNEFPSYVASKSGVTGYMKNCAIRLANEFKATCNAVCFGGVETELNAPVMNDPVLWKKIMDVTPLKRWATVSEAAEWCYFMTAVNAFCTGQAIDISGGERNCADLFVW